MALSEKNIFSFTWQIKNFSMCPHVYGEYLESPTFTVSGTAWRLYIFPRGDQDKNYVACYLERTGSTNEEKTITVSGQFIAHSVHGKNVYGTLENEIFKKDCGIGDSQFCLREDILNTVNGFLPKDTLTIECRMALIDGEEKIPESSAPIFGNSDLALSDSAIQKEMFTTFARDELLNFQTQFASNHYLARTCLQVSRKCIVWPIRRFGALQPDQRLSFPVVTAGTCAPSVVVMTLYLSGESVEDQNVQIEIRTAESKKTKTCFVRCRITAVNSSMKAQLVAEDEHFFLPKKKNDVWKFPTFIQVSTLIEQKYLDATQGSLILQCEFAFSYEGEEFQTKGIDYVPLLNQFSKPVKGEFNDAQSMYKRVYEEAKFSDVTLRTGDRTFKAHKNILSAISPVFRAMFETDMRENESGIVDITDYDPDTVEQLLIFIYTNSLEDLQQEKAVSLYSVADKYEVLSLKWQCSNLLKSTLSTSNVCEVLILADLHQDGDLLYHVQKYIEVNSDAILNSQMWKELMKSNASLASQVMLDMLTGKMDHF